MARSTSLRSESNREGLSFLLPVYKETPVQYGKATERRFTTPSEPGAREQRGARKKGTGTEKKEIMEAGERRWSAGSRGVPLSSRKVSSAMSIEPKWRRAECSVATDDGRHIYRRKTMIKDREEGERN